MKKRPAASQTGPKTKKPHLDKATDSKAKKRSKPVTRALVEDSADSSEDEVSEDAQEEAVDEMEVDETEVSTMPKDPNGPSSFA